ncbi:MAG: prepilin-type N-terminal cleavage/methylation domain-containing protein, partial [Patescibacteria group bacterium]
MAKINSKKKGFTLVEILIVLGIVAMLSVLAVNGYMSYRKSTLLDFAADNLIAQINEMKSKTRHGGGDSVKFEEIKAELEGGGSVDGEDVGSDSGSQCYGIYFENSGDGFVAKSFVRPFGNQKVWDPGEGKWNYNGCGNFIP